MNRALFRKLALSPSVALLVVLGLFAGASATAEQTGEPPGKAGRLLGIEDAKRDPRKIEDPAQKKYAKTITGEMVCLCGTCPREPMSECTCGWAYENRRIVDIALLEGKTKAQILDAYQEAFGLKVMGAPPDTGLGRLSYIIPYVAASASLVLVLILGLRMRRRSPGAARVSKTASEPAASSRAPADDEAQKILARELDELD